MAGARPLRNINSKRYKSKIKQARGGGGSDKEEIYCYNSTWLPLHAC